jgi:hypothetical protein
MIVAEKDVHLEPEEGQHAGQRDDEDVEAHSNLNVNLEPNEEVGLGQTMGKDDDDDVEAHQNMGG